MNASGLVCQSFGKPSRFSKTVGTPAAGEQGHSILGVLVKVGIEDALIHEVGLTLDWEQHPAQIMQLKRRQADRAVQPQPARCSARIRKRPARGQG